MAALARESAGEVVIRAQFPRKLEPLLGKRSRYKVLHGGRGGAKSWGIARALLIRGVNEPGLRVLCTREVQSSMKESVHQLLKDQIVALGLSDFYRVLESEIRGPGGTVFIFKGLSDPEALKSAEGVDVVWVEEARNVSKNSWDKLIPTIRKDGSEIWVSFNPELETDETYKRFVLKPPPGAEVIRINWYDNPWFPKVLYDEMARLRDSEDEDDQDDYLHIYEGHCKAALEGAIYAKELRKLTKTQRLCKFSLVPHRPVHTFWDLGRSDDTAIWFVQMFGLEHRILRYYANHGEHISHYIEELERLKEEEGYHFGTMWLPHDADEKRLQSKLTTRQQVEQAGFTVKITPKISVAEGIQAARGIFPNCYFHEVDAAEGVNALRAYRYKVRQVDGAAVHDKEPLHNWASNGADAFRYLAVAMQPEKPKRDGPKPPPRSRLSPSPRSWMAR